MDRTITRSGTYSGFLMHVARRRQQWRLLLLPLVALAAAAYSLRLIDRSRLKAINLRLLVGKSFNRAEIAPLAESYADQVIARGVHAAALDQIAADRAAGYRVLLATASFHLYVDAIARRLGIDDVLATRLDAPDGADHIHARLAGDNCYGAAKFARIGEWLADNAITREDAHIRAYSDHVSDHPMLGFADEAVATTPSRALKKLAPQRGWAVVDWRQKT
ncbi:MAG TPA: HAD-IB family hydrolase [Sphingopyxis terrae]|nr:MAG: HAD-IB family hydrolase [Sphingopyxis terrae]KTE75462.1 haloacid dehalogenase [Sphingopyxis sp. A083]MBN8804570.1 HAD-IB family hydrolase [Sphingopyxis terrae]MBU7589571.1 HAD-IB family hydrolase [Sphingopyxis terrae]HRE36133.1 HAD-IB family hydrolase [Sphingopyxis terrae]